MPKKRLSIFLALVALLGVLFVAHALTVSSNTFTWNPGTGNWELNGVNWTSTFSPGDRLCARVTSRPAGTVLGDVACTPPAIGGGTANCSIPGSMVANQANGFDVLLYDALISCPGIGNVGPIVGTNTDPGGPVAHATAVCTGPNAVTLAGFKAGSGSAPLFLLPLGIVLASGVAFVARKRSLS